VVNAMLPKPVRAPALASLPPGLLRAGAQLLGAHPGQQSPPPPPQPQQQPIARPFASANAPPLNAVAMAQVPPNPVEARRRAVQQALERCRGGHGPSGIQQAPQSFPLPSLQPMDDLHAHDVAKLPGLVGGLEVYVERSQSAEAVAQHHSAVKSFAKLLVGLAAEIFSVDPDCVKVYWDAHGATAAFNNGRGQLFFNAWVFVREAQSPELPETVSTWFGIFAHELAHNAVAQHDASFAQALEMICVQFVGALARFVERRGLQLP
jgi:hypothetical protein